MLPNPEIRPVTMQDYIKIIQKRLPVVIAFLVIIPSATAIILFTQRPIYRATVSINIGQRTPQVVRFQESYPQSYGYWDMKEYYQTQYRILGSRPLIEEVFNELSLVKDPDFQGLKDPVGKLDSQVKIDPIKDSQIVLVHVEDTDALRASSVANALARVYIRQDVQFRNRAAREALSWLDSQLTEIKKKMEASEMALNKYIQDNRIVTVPDIEKKTETLLQNLKQDKAKLEIECAEASKRYKAKHPKMIALNAQLEDVNKKIEQETDNLLDLNQKMVQYNILKKDVESNQQLYTTLLTGSKERGVTQTIETSPMRIIDPAKPPSAPFKPNKGRDMFRSILISLLLGVGSVFFLEYLESTIRTADEVSIYLNLPFLGYIPCADKEAKTDIERSLICYKKPQSEITESYRAIRTSLLFVSPEDRPLKSILITSSLPQEGKTFVSVNLATVFCQLNERVILIGMDMRKPQVHKSFNLEQKIGLSEFLTGNEPLEKVIKPTPIPNLSLITSGIIPPNPSELLSSGKIRMLFEELKERFDRIILDSPPILNVSDTLILAGMVDGIVLIIKGASTRLEAAGRAKQKILEAKGKILDVVINNIEPEKEDSYYYHHYYYSEEGEKQKK